MTARQLVLPIAAFVGADLAVLLVLRGGQSPFGPVPAGGADGPWQEAAAPCRS